MKNEEGGEGMEKTNGQDLPAMIGFGQEIRLKGKNGITFHEIGFYLDEVCEEPYYRVEVMGITVEDITVIRNDDGTWGSADHPEPLGACTEMARWLRTEPTLAIHVDG